MVFPSYHNRNTSIHNGRPLQQRSTDRTNLGRGDERILLAVESRFHGTWLPPLRYRLPRTLYSGFQQSRNVRFTESFLNNIVVKCTKNRTLLLIVPASVELPGITLLA